MKVTPKTEKEIYEANLLPDGWYPFTIATAEEKVSKKGNEMIEINVKIYRGEGFSFVRDYLMDTEFGAGKLRHLSETCGLLDAYESGGIEATMLVNREGFARIGREKSKDPQFADKNKILDFATQPPEPKEKEAKKAAEHARIATGEKRPSPANDDAAEDDIPF